MDPRHRDFLEEHFLVFQFAAKLHHYKITTYVWPTMLKCVYSRLTNAILPKIGLALSSSKIFRRKDDSMFLLLQLFNSFFLTSWVGLIKNNVDDLEFWRCAHLIETSLRNFCSSPQVKKLVQFVQDNMFFGNPPQPNINTLHNFSDHIYALELNKPAQQPFP